MTPRAVNVPTGRDRVKPRQGVRERIGGGMSQAFRLQQYATIKPPKLSRTPHQVKM
jgi:hypothetical protein